MLWMFAMKVRNKNTCNFIHSSDHIDEKPTTIISRSLNDGFLVFKELIAMIQVVQVDTSMVARCINSVSGNDNKIWMWNVIVKLNRARIISDLTRRKWVHKFTTSHALSTEARSAAEEPSPESVVRGLSSLGAGPPRKVSPRGVSPSASPPRASLPRTSSPRADPTTVVGPTQYSWDALESSLLDFITARSQHEDMSPLDVLVEEQAVANLREATYIVGDSRKSIHSKALTSRCRYIVLSYKKLDERYERKKSNIIFTASLCTNIKITGSRTSNERAICREAISKKYRKTGKTDLLCIT
jgi:hypothetical protein